jgi:hypothetical protein
VEELLVTLACATSHGCQPTASLYYEHRPSLRQEVEVLERRLKANVPKLVLHAVGPIAVAALGGTGILQLTTYTNLEVQREKTTFNFVYRY